MTLNLDRINKIYRMEIEAITDAMSGNARTS
jgi:hypothetical protein